jgi:hypothetical protein
VLILHPSDPALNIAMIPAVAVPRFPRTLTAGMELQLVIQDVVAEPCALLLQNSSILQVRCAFASGQHMGVLLLLRHASQVHLTV